MEAAIPAKSKKRSHNTAKSSSSSHRGGRSGPGGQQQARKSAKNKMPGTVVALLILTAVQAFGAIGGGVGLVRDPVNNIGLSTSLLEGTPFKDYLIPGLILLIAVGLFALLVLAGLLRHWRPAWWLSIASGGALVIWIIVEGAMLGYLPGSGVTLQIVFGLIGVAIVVLDLLRSTRRYYRISS
jgi:hypothetical protein